MIWPHRKAQTGGRCVLSSLFPEATHFPTETESAPRDPLGKVQRLAEALAKAEPTGPIRLTPAKARGARQTMAAVWAKAKGSCHQDWVA